MENQSNNDTLFVMQISIKGQHVAPLRVGRNDDASQLAQMFVKQYDLPQIQIPTLYQKINTIRQHMLKSNPITSPPQPPASAPTTAHVSQSVASITQAQTQTQTASQVLDTIADTMIPERVNSMQEITQSEWIDPSAFEMSATVTDKKTTNVKNDQFITHQPERQGSNDRDSTVTSESSSSITENGNSTNVSTNPSVSTSDKIVSNIQPPQLSEGLETINQNEHKQKTDIKLSESLTPEQLDEQIQLLQQELNAFYTNEKSLYSDKNLAKLMRSPPKKDIQTNAKTKQSAKKHKKRKIAKKNENNIETEKHKHSDLFKPDIDPAKLYDNAKAKHYSYSKNNITKNISDQFYSVNESEQSLSVSDSIKNAGTKPKRRNKHNKNKKSKNVIPHQPRTKKKTKTFRRRSNNHWWKKLYADNRKLMRKRAIMQEQEKRRKQENEIQDCTFYPQISIPAKMLTRQGSKVWKRIIDPMGIDREEKLAQLRQQTKHFRKLQDDQFSYTPTLTPQTMKIARKRAKRLAQKQSSNKKHKLNQSKETVFQRLYSSPIHSLRKKVVYDFQTQSSRKPKKSRSRSMYDTSTSTTKHKTSSTKKKTKTCLSTKHSKTDKKSQSKPVFQRLYENSFDKKTMLFHPDEDYTFHPRIQQGKYAQHMLSDERRAVHDVSQYLYTTHTTAFDAHTCLDTPKKFIETFREDTTKSTKKEELLKSPVVQEKIKKLDKLYEQQNPHLTLRPETNRKSQDIVKQIIIKQVNEIFNVLDINQSEVVSLPIESYLMKNLSLLGISSYQSKMINSIQTNFLQNGKQFITKQEFEKAYILIQENIQQALPFTNRMGIDKHYEGASRRLKYNLNASQNNYNNNAKNIV